MNTEDKVLLERAQKLSEENNRMLKSIQRIIKFGQIWGIIKLAIIIIPLVIGYLFLEPYFGSASDTFNNAKELMNLYK